MKMAFIDLDGTLVDSSRRHVKVMNDILLQYGLNFSVGNEYLSYKAEGNTTKDFLINCMKVDEIISEKIASEWRNKIENQTYLQYDFVYDDAVPFLDKLAKKYDIAILTARKNKEGVHRFVMESDFNFLVNALYIVDPSNAINEKTKILKSIRKSDSIFIGDTEVDYEAGKISGVKTFILNRGFRSENYWMKRGIDSFQNLLDILGCLKETSGI